MLGGQWAVVRRILVAFLLNTAIGPSQALGQNEGSSSVTHGSFVDDAMAALGFDERKRDSLLGGEVLFVGVPDIERQPNELTVASVMLLVRRPLDSIDEVFLDEASFRVRDDILSFNYVGDGSESRKQRQGAFEGIEYSTQEQKEVEKLLRVKPGVEFNFSSEEIDRFHLPDSESATRETASAIYRQVLLDRYLAYLDTGLKSLLPYERAKGKRSSPRRELLIGLESLELVEKHFPKFYRSLLEYPSQMAEGISSRYYWFKRVTNKRPTFVLAHRLDQMLSRSAIAAELQFYVGHSYNSMLTLIGCATVEGGTLVFAVVRIYTDKVTGKGSSLKKKIGRRQMSNAIAEHFEALRTELERQGP